MKAAIVEITEGNMALFDNIADDVFDAPIEPERLQAFVASPAQSLFVALAGDTVIGQGRGLAYHRPDMAPELFIDNLGVTAAHRRRGVATALIEAILNWGEKLGCSTFWVATEADNKPAIALYETFKWKTEGVAMFHGVFRNKAQERDSARSKI
ncbi:MAG: GNAT family N-acetyltransferase [Pseudomonadota bacterium]